MSKEISLTNGGIVLVDEEDFQKLSAFKWHRRTNGIHSYAYRMKNGTTLAMHRVIINIPDGMQTDHIDGNGLNNLRSNLRVATCAQNQFNASGWPGTSIFKGVHWDKWHKKWRVMIRITYRRIFLGYFKSELEAAKSYNEAALKYHGYFAKLNNV